MARAIAALIAASVAAALSLAFAPQAGSQPASPKLSNIGAGALASPRDLFLKVAGEAPRAGQCEILSPDPAYVNEMLVRFGEGGAKSFERRAALVVGNGGYQAIGRLANPANDAASMAQMFRALGFTVYRGVDLKSGELEDCLRRFKTDLAASPPDVALFFYAGHGVQLTSAADNEKRNYMLAVDANVDASGKASGFKQIDAVLNEMRAHSKQAVFLYDACRNAPVGVETIASAEGVATKRQTSLGAAAINPESDAASQAGIFIAYATSPGKTADDSWGGEGSKHSPFTEALLKRLPTPGATLDEALARAFSDVGALTAWKQTPWTNSSLTDPLRFNGSVSTVDLRAEVGRFANRAGDLRTRGLRGPAMAAALSAFPRGSASPRETAAALKELRSAFMMREWRLAESVIDVRRTAFSADGRFIATASSDGAARLWDAGGGTLVRRLEAHPGEVVTSAAFSPDGRRVVTASTDNTARVWDAATGAPFFTLQHAANVNFAAFSPSGRFIVTASDDRTVRLWNAATGAPVQTFESAHGFVTAELSPDETRVVALGADGSVEVYARSGVSTRLSGFGFRSAVFSPDGARIATASSDRLARIWDAATGQELKALAGHTGAVNTVAFSSDGRLLATASEDATARVWDVSDLANARLLGEPLRHTGFVLSAAISPDSKWVLTSGLDNTAHLWAISNGAPLRMVRAYDPATRIWVNSASYSQDGKRIVTGSSDGVAQIWDAETGASLRRIAGHQNQIYGAVFSPDDTRIATASFDTTARLWDASTGALLSTLPHQDRVFTAAFSPDGHHLATASTDGAAHIFDLAACGASCAPSRLLAHQGWVSGVAYSADGSLIATASGDKSVRLWDASTGAERRRFETAGLDPYAVSLSPDRRRLAAGLQNGAILVWNVETGEQLLKFGSGDIVHSAFFSPDGRLIVTAGDNTARVWDAASGDELASLTGHDPWVLSAAFSPGGRRVVTSSADGAFRVWDASLLVDATSPDLPIRALGLLPEDLAAQVERDRIRYWEVDPELLQ